MGVHWFGQWHKRSNFSRLVSLLFDGSVLDRFRACLAACPTLCQLFCLSLTTLVQAFPYPANPQRALDKYPGILVSTKKIKWYR
jgi:hypothetical protein